MRQTVVLKKQAMMIDKQDKVIRTQSGWCAKRRAPCIDEKPGAFRIYPKMMKDLHNLRPSGLQPETRVKRPCPEPDYDRNEDACAASSSDMRLNPQAASSADQQQLQQIQDDVDQLKELTSTFEAEVKNTFREVANNQEECDQEFKKIRVQIKNLHRDVCRMRGKAQRTIAPRNVRISMEACCGCGGPISDEEDGTPGGIACAGCRHRLCGIWCVVENAGQGPRCRHCTRMAIAISGTPDGGAQHQEVIPSRPSSSRNTEAEQIEKRYSMPPSNLLCELRVQSILATYAKNTQDFS